MRRVCVRSIYSVLLRVRNDNNNILVSFFLSFIYFFSSILMTKRLVFGRLISIIHARARVILRVWGIPTYD